MSARATQLTKEAKRQRQIDSLMGRVKKLDLDTAEHFLLIALATILHRRNRRGSR